MILEMKIPSPGESITEVEIAQWLVESGDYVEKDQAIAEIDSDKATLELPAEASGAIELLAEEGDTVEVGQIVCKIDTSVKGSLKAAPKEEKQEVKKEEAPAKAEAKSIETAAKKEETKTTVADDLKASPVAKEMIEKNGLNAGRIDGSGPNGRILKSDVVAFMSGGFDASAAAGWGGTRDERREKMSMLRRKVAERLVSVKSETAMLTTFNEIDMSFVRAVRSKYKEQFKEKHQVGLGFMSFFTKACTEA